MMPAVYKLLVTRFYQLNTGFFLFLILLLFGLADGKATIDFHYSVMKMAGQSAPFMAALMGLWLLYGMKCAGFVLRSLHEPANRFLYELEAWPRKKQYAQMLLCQICIYAPALLYAAATAGVAVATGHAASMLIITCFITVVCCCSAAIYRSSLSPYRASRWTGMLPSFRLPGVKKRLYMICLHFLLANHKKTLFLLKVFSLALLQVMIAYNAESLSKESVCFFVMIIAIAHALLPYYVVSFTEQRLSFMRNMPLPLSQRYLLYAIAYAIILLPELGFLLLHTHHAIALPVIGRLYLLALALLCFCTALWYLPRMQVERYMLLVLVLFFVSVFLMAGIDIGAYSLALMALAAGIFHIRYERYEHQSDNVE